MRNHDFNRPILRISHLDVWGHSRMSDYGASITDYGLAHKIDGLLQPATFDAVAIGGAIHSYHNRGNGALGDGGWAHCANEWDRQEQVFGKGSTTTTSAETAGTNVAVTVADRNSFYANQYVVYGAGTNTEICQIVTSYVATTGAGDITLKSVANTHSSGEPFYNAPRNDGYLPKCQFSLGGVGFNDLGYLGPFAQGTFGTNPGASRGLIPLQEALRFTLAQIRCAVIFKNTHPSCIYGGGGWNFAAFANGSYPEVMGFGQGSTNGLQYTTTNNSTITFSTPPDFEGGTVPVFMMANTSGAGSDWDVSVSGATTISAPLAFSSKNKNAVIHNAANSNSLTYTGVCYRITGLNAGVNTIVLTSKNISTSSTFLGWGIEAITSPLIYLLLDPRSSNYDAAVGNPYCPRAPVNTQTANTTSGSTTVTLGSAITIGTTSANVNAVYPGDTITCGHGLSDQETRRIASITDTTHVVVDSNFTKTRSGQTEDCRIGFQDADLVGGGYVNGSDTQGATSVPGVHAAIKSIAAEFPANDVRLLDVDKALNWTSGRPDLVVSSLNFVGDGIHYNNRSHAKISGYFGEDLDRRPWTLPQMTNPIVQQRRTWIGVYGDVGATPTTSPANTYYLNSWTNAYPSNVAFPRTGYYKDFRTREVFLRIACYGGAEDTIIFVLPQGYLPDGATSIPGTGPAGPAIIYVQLTGAVQIVSGWGGPGSSTDPYVFSGSFIAGGPY